MCSDGRRDERSTLHELVAGERRRPTSHRQTPEAERRRLGAAALGCRARERGAADRAVHISEPTSRACTMALQTAQTAQMGETPDCLLTAGGLWRGSLVARRLSNAKANCEQRQACKCRRMSRSVVVCLVTLLTRESRESKAGRYRLACSRRTSGGQRVSDEDGQRAVARGHAEQVSLLERCKRAATLSHV